MTNLETLNAMHEHADAFAYDEIHEAAEAMGFWNDAATVKTLAAKFTGATAQYRSKCAAVAGIERRIAGHKESVQRCSF